MKRYVKPDLYYENFELSVGVASCAYQVNKDGTYKGYYGSDPEGSEFGSMTRDAGGFANTSVCGIVAEIYGYYGGKDSMFGS